MTLLKYIEPGGKLKGKAKVNVFGARLVEATFCLPAPSIAVLSTYCVREVVVC